MENTTENVIESDVETASFQVEKMYCVSCPFVVQTAIERSEGVIDVDVIIKDSTGTVRVNFDNKVTDIDTL